MHAQLQMSLAERRRKEEEDEEAVGDGREGKRVEEAQHVPCERGPAV